jgi:hypothetical protein
MKESSGDRRKVIKALLVAAEWLERMPSMHEATRAGLAGADEIAVKATAGRAAAFVRENGEAFAVWKDGFAQAMRNGDIPGQIALQEAGKGLLKGVKVLAGLLLTQDAGLKDCARVLKGKDPAEIARLVKGYISETGTPGWGHASVRHHELSAAATGPSSLATAALVTEMLRADQEFGDLLALRLALPDQDLDELRLLLLMP